MFEKVITKTFELKTTGDRVCYYHEKETPIFIGMIGVEKEALKQTVQYIPKIITIQFCIEENESNIDEATIYYPMTPEMENDK